MRPTGSLDCESSSITIRAGPSSAIPFARRRRTRCSGPQTAASSVSRAMSRGNKRSQSQSRFADGRQGRHPLVPRPIQASGGRQHRLEFIEASPLDFRGVEIIKELPFGAPVLGEFGGLESEDQSPGPVCRVPSSPDSLEPVWEAQAQYRPATQRRQSLSQHRPQIHTLLAASLSVASYQLVNSRRNARCRRHSSRDFGKSRR